MLGEGDMRSHARLWNEETAPSHRLSAVLHPLPSPQHQLHCLRTEGTKAQPREFWNGGTENEGGGRYKLALLSPGQSPSQTPRALE